MRFRKIREKETHKQLCTIEIVLIEIFFLPPYVRPPSRCGSIALLSPSRLEAPEADCIYHLAL